ncbi:MAG: DUF262 domain-containing protein [Vicinamibacterales bacterium]|nr:DUF262 domain-containing protein [Vicinamibacterales bacterium]
MAFFKKAHDEGRLQIKPPFQRNPVWTDLQKSFLIDSILKGYPIPELYIQDLVTDAGEEQHVVVDGQQRVRACLEFVEGAFALHPDEVPEWPDMVFEDLTPTERQRIFAYNFIVRQLPAVAEEELRSIFKRLNRNTVVLNQQELRHATYKGEFITAVEALADLDWWSTSGVFTPNDVRRMLDVEFIAELTVGVLHGPQNKKLTLERWFQTYEASFPDKDRVLALFPKVLGELTQTVAEFPKTRWRKKSDFYSIFLLYAAHETALPLSKTGRKDMGSRMQRFGDSVDSYLTQRGSAPKVVTEYAEAVERAASDLSNRRARLAALEKYTKTAWST